MFLQIRNFSISPVKKTVAPNCGTQGVSWVMHARPENYNALEQELRRTQETESRLGAIPRNDQIDLEQQQLL
jgi:hypothetical protein